MKKLFIIALLAFGFISTSSAQKYKIITVVESIVGSGIGRSRIIDATEQKNYMDFTTSRTKNNQKSNRSKRSELRTKEFEETKILNFYNIGGIRFQNIASNDAIVASKLDQIDKDGYDLVFVNSAVESDAGEQDRKGIFITRYVFKKR